MGRASLISWWQRTRYLRQVTKAIDSTVGQPSKPRPLLTGPGVVLVPFDPVHAALANPFIQDLCKSLEGPVRLVGPVASLRWSPETSLPPLEIPMGLSPRGFREWLEYHRAHRADWCLLVSREPAPLEEACLAWFGSGARISSLGACLSDSANVKLQTEPEPSLDQHLRRTVRTVVANFPQRIPQLSAKSGPQVLEIPPSLADKGSRTRAFADHITRLATIQPLLLAHSETLPTIIADTVRSLGPRIALVHLTSARDVQELAKRTRLFVGVRTPATALATLAGCQVRLLGPPEDTKDFPPEGVFAVSQKILRQELDETV
ncbi:MAG: hypothetical protein IPO40_02970 [Fibrobacteres bacterium]|nr:hypothetical protein [Fibrobacterota bacterium]